MPKLLATPRFCVACEELVLPLLLGASCGTTMVWIHAHNVHLPTTHWWLHPACVRTEHDRAIAR